MADPNAAAAEVPPVDAAIIAATQEIVGGLIERPRMAPNLLNRPPYRFIHDTITGILTKTGFFQGLFVEAEIANPAAHSREIKTSFLKKLIDALMMITGKAYTKPSRILAGMDADQTNILFQDLVSAARNLPSSDAAGVVQRTLSLQGAADSAPQPAAPPPAPAPAPAVPNQPIAAPARPVQPANPPPQPLETSGPARVKSPLLQPNPNAPAPAAAPPIPAPAPAPVAPVAMAPPPAAMNASPPPIASGAPPSFEQYAPIVAAGAGRDLASQIKLTTDLLNQIITRPRLSDRLLSQPPLKFLADICASVIAATGFPQGLFVEAEFNLTSGADKAVKASFCQKLVQICAVGMSVLLGPNYVQNPVTAKRITAGQEPENTNWLLQELAVVACSSAASHPAVLSAIQQLAEGGAQPAPAAPQPEPEPAMEPTQPAQPPAGVRALALNTIGGMTDSQPPQPTMANSPPAVGTGASGPVRPMGMPRLALGDITKPPPLSTEEAQYVARPENTNVEAPNNSAAESASKPAGSFNRPRTARIGPPRIRTNVVDDKPPAPAEAERLETKAATGVITEGAAAPAEDEDDEAEAAENPNDLGIDASGEHGMLVNRMFAAHGASKAKSKEPVRPKPNAPYSQQQLEDLRQQIQKLCQSANPLGKCMEMVYEDMDQMNRELSVWKNAYQEQHDRLEEEARETAEVLAPLQKKLDAVQQAIEEQEKKLVQAKAAILRNDTTIKKLLDT